MDVARSSVLASMKQFQAEVQRSIETIENIANPETNAARIAEAQQLADAERALRLAAESLLRPLRKRLGLSEMLRRSQSARWKRWSYRYNSFKPSTKNSLLRESGIIRSSLQVRRSIYRHCGRK
uniref:Uncharacterized protein n=1 Tax=Thermosporothrix sp. COM3 TaxID=2490863 RepID=A0A455T349_9CHLR|nr:hypothetical protein KTC_65450 [Thermosporothrix sp. COM3]